MKNFLLLILFIFSTISYAQDELVIYDSYLHELITTTEEKFIINFDSKSISQRKAIVEKITSNINYDPSFIKAAMILHMLNYKLGDEDYNKGIDTYIFELNQSNQTATVKSFKESLENQIDVDLSDFFNDWFIGKGFPSYEISWFQNKENNTISITAKQNQSNSSVSFFEMPIPIKVSSEDGESQFIRLELGENKQSFTGSIPFNIKTIEIDPEYQLISKNNIVKAGMDQEVLNTTISLYPNPARNSLNIQNSSEAKVEKISIYNMLGKLVLQETNPIVAINLKSLTFGIHLVKIETTQGTLHKTILKEQ
ncbi:MAG: T9SS type A sorting domain-containing protein [Flavobacteriaceae bacterium]|nr:T9SS type A sorting domain-containing protein [Flavobacteriaceae bacterium]